ncbi:MAG: hypothetical protein JXR77_10270, partial [Lentisphaeria bacterium]|nr:hypothetical protein [Lentisphaeria bacterium]
MNPLRGRPVRDCRDWLRRGRQHVPSLPRRPPAGHRHIPAAALTVLEALAEWKADVWHETQGS